MTQRLLVIDSGVVDIVCNVYVTALFSGYIFDI